MQLCPTTGPPRFPRRGACDPSDRGVASEFVRHLAGPPAVGPVALVACVVLLVLPASTPAATPPSCQVVITQDVTFDRDLDCENQGPITIGADDVTVDLAGHTLSSTFGALLRSRGHDHVKLLNGGLMTAAVAVEMSGRHNLVRNVSGFGQHGGVWFHDGSRNRIVDSTIDGGGVGPAYLLEHERRDTISGKTAAGGEVDLHATRSSRVVGNDVPPGIVLDSDSRRNRLADNRAQGFRAPGLSVAGARNRLLDNVVSEPAADEGILITGRRNLLVGNRV